MQNKITKRISFLLVGFFAFSYLIANPHAGGEYNTVGAYAERTVILGGQSIGVNISVEGIMVLGISDFYGEDGKKHCPAKESGLKKGDIITSVNNEQISSSLEFSGFVDKNGGNPINISYKRDDQVYYSTLTPVKGRDDSLYHLGLWARDGTTGIGTLTFIDPDTNIYGALGHGVTDADTGDLIEGKGNIYFSSVSGIKKAKPSLAGELEGYFISSEIGDIKSNNQFGIFGNITEKSENAKSVTVASREQVATGEAKMYCCIDGNKIREFTVNIDKINIDSKDNKSMVIKITDQKLLDHTGGILQGMSGAPLVQNGKLIGAVTHVFVNDPTRGYAIFIENMLEEANKIK